MPGEKPSFFSPSGLMLSRVEYEDTIAAFANDARVTINVFQVGGCCSSWYINAGMRNVAQQTGGQASIGEYARQGLARLNEVTKAEYLLGYYPKNDNWDGAYRNIEIKVNRPGLRVAFRHGYYANDKRQILNREEFLAYSRIMDAAAYTSDITAYGSYTRRYCRIFPLIIIEQVNNRPYLPQIKVDLKVSPGKIRLVDLSGRHVGKLRVTIFYANPRGQYLGDVWKKVDLNLREETYQLYLISGIPF